jgi:hypothetical protein
MWLPECAVDDSTLESLADAELKFTILASDQGHFRDDGSTAHSAGPFRWQSDGKSVAVFRFDRGLSNAVSFGDALADGAALAAMIADAASALGEGEALLIATDGETFGHHKKAGAAELARALIMLERRDDVVVTNCAGYLADHPPRGEFRTNSPSSWSCPHGIERWRADCGCRIDPHTSQEWRAPLRAAMEVVAGHAGASFLRFAADLVANPRAAALEAIRLLVDANPAAHEAFFARHGVADEDRRTRLLRLVEMLRAGQAALTSCAWFFDDFGGLEGRVALRWAARAVELAGELAPSIEPELLDRLRRIHSNRRDIGDAATLYLSLKTREARGRV